MEGFCESTRNARVAFRGVFFRYTSGNVKPRTHLIEPQGKLEK